MLLLLGSFDGLGKFSKFPITTTDSINSGTPCNRTSNPKIRMSLKTIITCIEYKEKVLTHNIIDERDVHDSRGKTFLSSS